MNEKFVFLSYRELNHGSLEGVMKTSALRCRPSTVDRWPDWCFLMVDVDHWGFPLVDVNQTEVFNWSTFNCQTEVFHWSTSTSRKPQCGWRSTSDVDAVFTDVFITPSLEPIADPSKILKHSKFKLFEGLIFNRPDFKWLNFSNCNSLSPDHLKTWPFKIETK